MRRLSLPLLVIGLLGCPPPLPLPVVPNPEPTPPEIDKPGPPLANRVDVVDEVHGTKVTDPYRWLEDAESDETQRYLQEFNAYTRTRLDNLPGRAALEKRLTELSYLDWVGPPSRRGERYFLSRRPKTVEKAIWYWRSSKDADDQILLDPNTMSEDGSTALKGVSFTYDGSKVAYKLSENNADESTMYVMDVATKVVSDIDVIPGAKYASASWTPAGEGFYYTWLPVDDAIPAKERPGYAEIRFHQLGNDPAKDEVLFPRTGDPKVFLDVELSRDGRYLFLYKYYGWTKSDVFFKDLSKHQQWQPLAVGHDAKFSVTAWRDRFYVRTNYEAPRWRLMGVDPAKPEMAAWQQVVAEHPKSVLRSSDVRGERLALNYMHNASSRLDLVEFDGTPVRTIELPGIGSVSGLTGNPEDDTAYYGFSSFTVPTTIYETSIKDGGRKPYFELDAPVDPSPYTTEQVWYPSKDGTQVSMFIVRRKDMKMNGTSPLLLTGYGGFNISKTPSFNARSYAWLEKGGAIAVPNLRGGGEYGEQWHRAGMLLEKQNVFDDFIAAADYLIANKYTSAERLAIMGASNGGLLVGAVMAQRPELYRAVVCSVPLLDMVRYHLFGSGKTWISEYGSADDPEQFKALLAYSPYHAVLRTQDKANTVFPAMLMLTADSDDRVDPLHARKFVAAMRHTMSNDANVLLRVESKAGHGGGDMVKKTVARSTDIYAFLFDELKMN